LAFLKVLIFESIIFDETQIKECTFLNDICFAYHIEPITLADGDYELIADQAEEIPGNTGDTVENLNEGPNQSSENLDPSTLNPAQEGKPRT
jgi:hypothetical protein